MVRSQALSDMTIAKLAKAVGVGVETVRYYQRRGLMAEPPRTGGTGLGGGIRRYAPSDVRRLRFIRSAQTSGFTLDEIGELIALDAVDDRARAFELATRRIAALDAKIQELHSARAALQHLAHGCRSTRSGPCPIIAAFDDPPM